MASASPANPTGPSGTAAVTTSASRPLLLAGATAGPLYVTLATVQALGREGFDPTRHAVSLLSNGDLGWIQIASFVVAGLLTVAGAMGLQRLLRGGAGGRWAPRLLAVYGGSLVAAGAFVADPSFGFPPGAPAGPPASPSWHGVLHLVTGGIGFLALIAACFVLARRFAGEDRRSWAVFSRLTGGVFLAAFVGIASGSGTAAINLAFTAAVGLAWAWITAVMLHLRARSSDAPQGPSSR